MKQENLKSIEEVIEKTFDKNYLRQLKNSMLPQARFMKQEIVVDEINKVDEDAYVSLNRIKSNIVDFVNDGKNLYLCSENTGNGKTTWSIKILQAWLYLSRDRLETYKHPTGMFISVPELIANLKDFNTTKAKQYVEYVKNHIDHADLVVWDDLAIEEMSGYDRLQLYVFLNNRIFRKQANIFTSNVVRSRTLEKLVGGRIKSRSLDVSEVITFSSIGGR